MKRSIKPLEAEHPLISPSLCFKENFPAAAIVLLQDMYMDDILQKKL